MNRDLEPFVDADEIAGLLDESRRNVIRMAREGKLTAYVLSGTQRHTDKFRRSEVNMKNAHSLIDPEFDRAAHKLPTRNHFQPLIKN